MTASGGFGGHQAGRPAQNAGNQASGRSRLIQARRRAPLVFLILLLILPFALLQAACLPDWLTASLKTFPTIIDVSFAERTEISGTSDFNGAIAAGTAEAATNTAATNAAGKTGTTATVGVTAVPTVSPVVFEQKVSQILHSGLQKGLTEIPLDAVILPRSIPESDVQVTIDRIYAAYRKLYSQHAEFFYLNGSINISYTLLRGRISYLDTLLVRPQYWEITRDLSASQLNRLISQVNEAADQVAAQVRTQTSEPWRQLLLIHDYLVRNIAYDPSDSQAKNQVISALLEHVTMCQGYAQSFQLIGQRLGHDILLIGGKYEGVGHAWNLVRLDGQYYHLDVTHDDPSPDGGAARPIEHVHFLRSDGRMKETHQWESGEYPACPSDGAQYYRQQQLVAESRNSLKKKLDQFVQGINFDKKTANLLELLYTGSDPPDSKALDALFQDALDPAAAGHTVYYRNHLTKGVVLVEITPG